MKRLSYRVFRFVAALNYQLPRKFTKVGLLVFVGMALTGAVGSDFDQSVAIQTFALLFCLLVVAILWVPTFRERFVARRALPELASVGQAFRYQVEVRSLSGRAYRDLEALEDLAEPLPSFEEFVQAVQPIHAIKTFRLAPRPGQGMEVRRAIVKPAKLTNLGPQGHASGEVEIVPLRRGPLRFRGLSVARSDPLGLIRSLSRIDLAQTVLVLPKRYRVPSLLFPGTRHYQPGGIALASSIGESEEFVSLREYRPGDAFRRIHWKSWARAGRPIVQEYQDEFFTRHGLVLDTFTSPVEFETFEEAVSVAASFACTLDTQESLLDLLFVGAKAFCFTAGRGLGQSEQVLEILASVRPTTDGQFAVLRDLVLRHASALSACTCVFMAWDAPRQELVKRLKALGLPVLTVVVTHDTPRASPTEIPEAHFLKPGEIAEGLLCLEGVAP